MMKANRAKKLPRQLFCFIVRRQDNKLGYDIIHLIFVFRTATRKFPACKRVPHIEELKYHRQASVFCYLSGLLWFGVLSISVPGR